MNPFSPGSPLPDAGLFAGRGAELREAVTFCAQIIGGMPRHYLITGPRGIGKTTVMLAFAGIARSENQYLNLVPGLEPGPPLLVAGHTAQPGENMGDVIADLIAKIRRQTSVFRGIQIDEGEIRLLVASLTFSRVADQGSAISKFVDALAAVMDDRRLNAPGIVLYVDELDAIADQDHVASFLKVLLEELPQRPLRNVGIMVAGQEGLAGQLAVHHGSAVRLFHQIRLPPLSDDEVRDLIETPLIGTTVAIDESGLAEVVMSCEGLPALAQLLGYEVFNAAILDAGMTIDGAAVRSAIEALKARGEWP